MVTRSLVSYDLTYLFNNEYNLDWMVTRSLVSYDNPVFVNACKLKLNGHQIIGELRPLLDT